LNKIEKVELVFSENPNYCFEFGKPDKVRPPVLRIDQGNFSYQKEPTPE